MTRWGFISDVHGNLPALERAIEACGAAGAEQLVYLGDLLGRGDSEGCVRLVRATARLAVVGNRDLDWSARVGPGAREYVLSLPRLAEAGDFVAVHGHAPLTRELSSDEVRRGARRAYRWLRLRGKRLLCFGHTHQARVWRKAGEDVPLEQLTGRRVPLPAEPDVVYLLNVGTTGLPFPGKGPPSCAVYDDGERWVELLELGPSRGRMVGLNE
jgi:predicted phosphodiesterase